MQPTLLVLTDYSPAAERARAYAAVLAPLLAATIHLVHVNPTPPPTSRAAVTLQTSTALDVLDNRQQLEQLAAELPVPASAQTLESKWDEAVRVALAEHRPLLLITGLTATDGALDEWLSNRTVPLAHQTGYPLLLVPEYLPDAALIRPRRIGLAVRAQPFTLTAEATALLPHLPAIGAVLVPVTVVPPTAPAANFPAPAPAAPNQSGLPEALNLDNGHQLVSEDPAAAIGQAIIDLSFDVLALLDPGHGWVKKLWRGSVIDQVLRQTRVPVLLLATQPTVPS